MEQQEYWNRASAEKVFTTPFQKDVFSNYVSRDAVILDVGCGYGRILEELYQIGYRNLLGFDFSAGMIERGRREFPHLDLRIMKAGHIDMPDHSADAVLLFAVLTCIPSDAEQEQLIAEVRRVLKPEGILYVNDFLLNEDERNLLRYRQYADRYGKYGIFELPEGAVLRHHEESRIRRLLKEFEEEEYRRITFTTMNGNQSNGFYFIGSLKAKFV